MKARLLGVFLLFAAIIAAVGGAAVYKGSTPYEDKRGEQIVALNEIEALYNAGDSERAAQKADELAESLRQSGGVGENDDSFAVWAVCIACALIVGAMLLYVYFTILRPFDRLKAFADRVARGDFETPLGLERGSFFGRFTWAFDSMRREITKARSCEREAIENNKTVIATLSHDIKTPVASIRAYAEGLEANMDSTPEKRERYLSVIMRKCDEVSSLTNDLFLHSLSDLDKLGVDAERFELIAFVKQALEELCAGQEDISFTAPAFTAEINADKKRLMQIIENLINNSRKYAKTHIFVTAAQAGDEVTLTFRDEGPGIDEEDMPFIFDKFYRGRNCGSEQGSGLGLYIVKYLAKKQGGDITLRNLPEGFEAEITLPKAK